MWPWVSSLIQSDPGALNAAKGSVRKDLSKDLFKVIQRLLRATCDKKEDLMFKYVQQLTKTNVWPLDLYYSSNSIEGTLEGLRNFEFPPTGHDCGVYPKDFKELVEQAVAYTKDCFQGLCLDCISRADKSNDDLKGHMERNARSGKWDKGCRIDHQQPSWYFSFIAR